MQESQLNQSSFDIAPKDTSHIHSEYLEEKNALDENDVEQSEEINLFKPPHLLGNSLQNYKVEEESQNEKIHHINKIKKKNNSEQ